MSTSSIVLENLDTFQGLDLSPLDSEFNRGIDGDVLVEEIKDLFDIGKPLAQKIVEEMTVQGYFKVENLRPNFSWVYLTEKAIEEALGL